VAETYDRYGNRWAQTLTSGTGPSVSLTFGNNGLNGSTNNRPNGYTFDASGNVTVEPTVPQQTYMTYDGENRLTGLSGGGGGATYTYDGNGLRVFRNVSSLGVSRASVYSGSQVIAEYDNDNEDPSTPAVEYIYNPAGGGLLAMFSNAGTTYYHQDHLSVRLTTDGTSGSPTYGQVLSQEGHFPFGELWYQSGPTNKWFFTGKERDSESGNDYFGARYYASSMGRWMSPDESLDGAIMELPQTWNKYSYEYNRPLYGTDPDGRCPPCIGAIIGGVVQGGFDLGKQLYNNGGSFSKVSWGEVGANTVGGAVTGALAGATGGASLLESAVVGDLAAGTTSSIVGGIVTRGLDPNTPSSDVLSAGAVSGDALAGFVGGAGGHIAGDFVHVPDEPTFSMTGRNGRVYNQAYRNGLRALATRDQALNNQAVRSSLGSSGSNIFGLWWNWFTNQPPPPPDPPMNPHSTVTIVGCTDMNGNPCQ
jgi:RHS repeat-associated protein